MLEAASVARMSFAPWTVARALGLDAEEVEPRGAYFQAQVGCSKWATRVGRPWTATSRI